MASGPSRRRQSGAAQGQRLRCRRRLPRRRLPMPSRALVRAASEGSRPTLASSSSTAAARAIAVGTAAELP
eukprot:802140-Alexandrium_andersonii.AAC.1